MGMIEPDMLPFDLEEQLGRIMTAEEIYPSVYHLCVQREGSILLQDYYVVTDTSAIFVKVKKYGEKIPGLRLYSLGEDDSGWRIIDYEIGKYRVKNNIPIPGGETLHSLALFAAEHHPEYFGQYPVPIYTPKGVTLRHRLLENGVYWLETDRGEELLAVCYPIWNGEFSHITQEIGEMTPYDRAYGIDKTMGYLFFSKQSSCVALFELMETRKQWEGTLIDRPALMNAIWEYLPRYALIKNGQEQMGINNLLALLMTEFHIDDIEPQIAYSRMICMYPGKGTDFLKLPE